MCSPTRYASAKARPSSHFPVTQLYQEFPQFEVGAHRYVRAKLRSDIRVQKAGDPKKQHVRSPCASPYFPGISFRSGVRLRPDFRLWWRRCGTIGLTASWSIRAAKVQSRRHRQSRIRAFTTPFGSEVVVSLRQPGERHRTLGFKQANETPSRIDRRIGAVHHD